MVTRRDRLGRRLASDGERLVPRRSGTMKAGIAGVVMVVVALFVAIPACQSYTKRREVVAVVTDKERVCESSTDGTGSQTCRYLVYTDAGTFRLTDSILIGRFDTSDVYGRIRRDRRYRMTVYGWRFGCTSSYPNIDTIEQVAG